MAALFTLTCSLAVSRAAPCQTDTLAKQSQSSELERAIATAQSDKEAVDPRDVVVIVHAGATQLIPALEKQFARTQDESTKLSIASGLVKLKDKDDVYWNYLLQQATLAIDSNIPDGMFSESLGKFTNASPELQTWADTHSVDLNTAMLDALRTFPGVVLKLAMASDPRAIPLLRRALDAHSAVLVSMAARGLVLLGDTASVSHIAAAADRFPGGYGGVIVQALIWVDSPEAQGIVDRTLPSKVAAAFRRTKAEGMPVLGW